MSLEEKLNTWYKPLQNVIKTKQMHKVSDAINQRRKVSRVYPHSDKLFRCFYETDFKSLTTIVLGQDPYPTYSATLDKPVADGLAFSTDDNDKVPPSLLKLQNAIEDDCYDGLRLEFSNDLTYLAKQGVLLLNRTLTVEHGAPLSHVDIGWDFLTKSVIKIACSQDKPIAIITFGKGPESIVSSLDIDKEYHQIINVEHPAYASRQGREMIHKNCFSKTNDFIRKNYGDSSCIKW